MSNIVKISVCVPVYGVEKYVERCCRSLFAQTLTDSVEFIFVNDCTLDSSINVLLSTLADYPARTKQVRIIDHQVNQGLSAARNTAVAAAVGKYVYHIDPDDFIAPNTLAELLQTAVDQQADIVANELIWYWDEHHKTVYYKKFSDRKDFIYKVLTRKLQCGVVGNLIKKALYTSNNISAPALNMGEDYVTTPRLAYYAKKIVLHPQPMYYYYKNNDTAMSRTPSLPRLQEMIAGHNYLVDFFQNTLERDDFSAYLDDMRLENFVIMFEYAVTDIEHLKYLRKNFPCNTWLIGSNYSLKVKIANIFFQLGWLHPIVWGTKLLRWMRLIKK